jgi:hypothetical protein
MKKSHWSISGVYGVLLFVFWPKCFAESTSQAKDLGFLMNVFAINIPKFG